MKVDTQNVASCKVKVIVKAEADETRKEYEEVIKTFMQQGRVPGFRPGKVPREIIKRDFHKEITEEVQGGSSARCTARRSTSRASKWCRFWTSATCFSRPRPVSPSP